MSKPLVAYFRVSTREQGRSGLGIDAQRAAVARFAAAEGYEVVGEFVEIETGKGADAIERRPQLAVARRARRGASSRQMRCRGFEARSPQPGRSFHLRLDGPSRAVRRRRVGTDVEPFMLHLYAALA